MIFHYIIFSLLYYFNIQKKNTTRAYRLVYQRDKIVSFKKSGTKLNKNKNIGPN